MYQRHDALYNIDDAGQIVTTGPILDDGLDHGKALLFGINMREIKNCTSVNIFKKCLKKHVLSHY